MSKLALIGCGLVMIGMLSDARPRAALAQNSPEAPKALPQERPSFEVASVRPAPEFRNGLNPAPRLPRALASGQFDATATLGMLIGWAFHNSPSIVKGPFRELDDVFVITAKAPGPVERTRPGVVGPMNYMLQSLLAERFKLRVRWGTRSVPVYALRRTSTEQLGRNLERLDPTCPESYPENLREAPDGCVSLLTMDRGKVTGFVSTMADFAKFVSTFAGMGVVDDTGLVGPFRLNTAFDPRSQSDSSPFPSENLQTLRDALRNDLGFKLEPGGQREVQVLIIEHVQQPTEN